MAVPAKATPIGENGQNPALYPGQEPALGDRAIKFFDRRQVGELFGISPARAARLIHGMGPMLHGTSLVVDAEDIRKLLSEMEKDREIRDLQWQLAGKRAETEQADRKSNTR